MTLSLKARRIWNIAIISVLCVALVCVSSVLVYKTAKYNDLMEQITANEKAISEKEAEINKLKEDHAAEKDSISSKLEEAENAKKRLEQENSTLKQQIANLKAQNGNKAPVVTIPTVPSNSNKVCYLTFDDGPSERTPEVLAVLNRYGVKATFFVAGNPRYPEYLRYLNDIKAGGHAIGVHTYSHDYAAIYRSPDEFFADQQKMIDQIYETTGIKPDIMRFPGGSSNTVSRKYDGGTKIMTKLTKMVTDKGFAYFDWNVSSNDATGGTVSATRIRNSVLGGAQGKQTICVLMHDAASKHTTVAALPSMIEGLIAQGFRFEVLTKNSPIFHHGINN